jgi:hypothetical protein
MDMPGPQRRHPPPPPLTAPPSVRILPRGAEPPGALPQASRRGLPLVHEAFGNDQVGLSLTNRRRKGTHEGPQSPRLPRSSESVNSLAHPLGGSPNKAWVTYDDAGSTRPYVLLTLGVTAGPRATCLIMIPRMGKAPDARDTREPPHQLYITMGATTYLVVSLILLVRGV